MAENKNIMTSGKALEKYDEIREFEPGVIKVVSSDNSEYYVNEKGEEIDPPLN